MTIQPNLFGGQFLVRNWGRIGSAGQLRIDLFDREDEAIIAHAEILRLKRKRGYRTLRPLQRRDIAPRDGV